MPLRNQLARIIGKTSQWFLTRFTKGGSALPGKLALQVDPNILEDLSKNYQVIVVTGTNGKTLTTALLVEILKQAYPYVLTNPSGSNMKQGIISTFLTAPQLDKAEKGIAVLEVDEASLAHVVDALAPDYFVFTNIFRDQLDRFGETHTIYQFLKDAALSVPQAKIIANGDLPMFNDPEITNEKVYFGFNHQESEEVTPQTNTDGLLCPSCDHLLHYHMISYANLGHYYCPHCLFERPALTYQVDAIHNLSIDACHFAINGQDFVIPIAGKYNIYNALAAYAVASELGLTADLIAKSFQQAKHVFGRQEKIQIKDKSVLVNLVKNPVGLNQVLEILSYDQTDFTLIAILNNQPADGTDVSWIWDGHFEMLKEMPVKYAYTAGDKVNDMTKRLIVAGLAEDKIESLSSIDQVVSAIEQSPTQQVHILTTYTAMLMLRQELAKANYI